MSKLEQMLLEEILNETNLYLTANSLYDIWKDEREIIPTNSPTAMQLFRQNRNLAYDLIGDINKLYEFLVKHESEIDKVKFVLVTLRASKERLRASAGFKTSSEEFKSIQQGVIGGSKLLKGINKTYVFHNVESGTNKITHLTVVNTAEEIEGKNRKERNSNLERLAKIEEKLQFPDVVQGILPIDLQWTMAFDENVGYEMRYMAEYNTIIEEYGKNPASIKENATMSELAGEIDRVKFIKETIRTLWLHIEEVNMDKMLLCAAYRYINGVELHEIKKDSVGTVKERLDIIRSQIKKNVTIDIYPDIKYSVREFEKDLKRFVGKEDNVEFLSTEEIKKFKDDILSGKISLTSLGKQNYNALSIDPAMLAMALQKNPNNYIFFLKEENCPYNKNTILQDIKNACICSTDLLELICEKSDITAEEVCELFDMQIISANDLMKIREKVGQIITPERLFEKYEEEKENKNENEESKIQLERYALAYRNTELIGRTEQDIQEKGEEFITCIGEKIEPTDLVPLYNLSIIPLKVAVDWGGENIIEELVQSESLRPSDARQLRDEGLLDENTLKRLFEKFVNMSYAYQVSLVFTIFDGQTTDEQKIREELAQYYHIENAEFKSIDKCEHKKKTSLSRGNNGESKVTNIRMRDPGAKYNLLSSIDKDVKIEQGITDGHIIFHYPSIDGGTVLIEKLHKIKTNRQSKLIEISADNESATYILSEEEFIKMKSLLIQDGKINRTELTKRWWQTRDPEHWIAHAGNSYWENAIKRRFNINIENSRYSQEDLNKIEQLIEKSIDSKKMDER